MEAIRAANLLMNHDANGADWIKFSRVLDAIKEGASFAEAAAASAASGSSRGRRGRGGRA
jgi:5-methyltetrahydrofolate--homocysteine methyltransferase